MKQYKRRYVAVKFYDQINKEECIKLIENTFKLLFGIFDYSFANIKLIYFNNNIGIFRLNNNYLEKFRITIFLLRDFQIKQARIITISGTVKRIKERLFIQEKVKS